MTKRTAAKEAAKVKADIKDQFAKLDTAAADSPGLETLLRVYGGYEAALRQVDDYFALLRPTPRFTVSTTSGEQSELNANVV
jgi:hypothetical protein